MPGSCSTPLVGVGGTENMPRKEQKISAGSVSQVDGSSCVPVGWRGEPEFSVFRKCEFQFNSDPLSRLDSPLPRVRNFCRIAQFESDCELWSPMLNFLRRVLNTFDLLLANCVVNCTASKLCGFHRTFRVVGSRGGIHWVGELSEQRRPESGTGWVWQCRRNFSFSLARLGSTSSALSGYCV